MRPAPAWPVPPIAESLITVIKLVDEFLCVVEEFLRLVRPILRLVRAPFRLLGGFLRAVSPLASLLGSLLHFAGALLSVRALGFLGPLFDEFSGLLGKFGPLLRPGRGFLSLVG